MKNESVSNGWRRIEPLIRKLDLETKRIILNELNLQYLSGSVDALSQQSKKKRG